MNQTNHPTPVSVRYNLVYSVGLFDDAEGGG